MHETTSKDLNPMTGTKENMKKKQRPNSFFKRKIVVASAAAVILCIFLLYQDDATGFYRQYQRYSPAKSPKVKIFMYDLPVNYTYGVLDHFYGARGHRVTLPYKYPSHQHSAEWHLFMDLTKPASKRVDTPAIRVYKPDEADFFFVPFFSSLSAIVNKTQWFVSASDPARPDPNYVYRDDKMQESLVDWLETQYHWRRNRGRDHVFVAQNPNALGRVMDRIKNAVLLVSDPDRACLVKDIMIPHSHRISVYDGRLGVQNRQTLLFFRGNRFQRKGGEIRDSLFLVLENEDDVVIKHGALSKETQQVATQGMHSSVFCLDPAGTSPASCRLFDAIISLCIPVIVSDDIELPFEDIIDYRKIAIFVNSSSAVKPGFLVNMLRGISTKTILEYQRELRLVKRFFLYDENPNGAVDEIWRQVSQKAPFVRLIKNRKKRLMKSDLNEPAGCSCFCSRSAESESESESSVYDN